MANEGMRDYWNGAQSEAWVRSQAAYDAMLGPYCDAILDAAGPGAGERVVDVGCGSGALSSAAAARVGAEGSVVGLDISESLVGLAADLYRGLPQVRFECCDVQTADLTPLAADLVVSRFGVMFFEDPVAAFENLATAVRPGGRLAFACWRTALENEWIMVPMAAVVPVVGIPDLPGPGAPGPFQMGEAGFVRETLGSAGWEAVDVVPFDCRISPGGARDVDEAVQFLTEEGMARRALDGKPDELRAEVAAAVRDALAPHWSARDGLTLAAAAWIVTARATDV